MKKLLVLITLAISACATNPNKAVYLDTKVERSAAVSDDSLIGVKDGNIIYQKKFLLNEELRRAQNNAREVEAKLYGGSRYYDNNGLLGSLQICKAQLSSMSDGKLSWTEKRDYVIPEDDFKMGIDESGKLSGITEEGLYTRIERFRQYKAVLDARSEEMETKISVCRAEVKFKENNRSVASEK